MTTRLGFIVMLLFPLAVGCNSTDANEEAKGPNLQGVWETPEGFELIGTGENGDTSGHRSLTVEIRQEGRSLSGEGQLHFPETVENEEPPTFTLSGNYEYPNVEATATYPEPDVALGPFTATCVVDTSEQLSCEYADSESHAQFTLMKQ